MMSDRRIEAIGYLISVASVVLLASAAWAGTAESDRLRLLVLVGAGFSIVGMGLRWLVFWHRHGHRNRKK